MRAKLKVLLVCAVTCALAVTAIAVGVGGSAAGTAAKKALRASMARHVLRTRQGRLLTTTARTALQMIAAGDRDTTAEGGVPGEPGAIDASGSKRAQGGAKQPQSLQPLVNVRVNNPALDTTQIDQTTQSETTIAVSGSNVVVGFNDSQQGLLVLTAAADLSGYGYSSDGGATFTDGGTIPNQPGLNNLGDPWLASDRAGNMYYGELAIDFSHFRLATAVAKSTTGGHSWTPPVVVSPPEEFFGDKDALAAGRDPSVASRDNLYLAWDDFGCDDVSCFNGLPVAHSTDGGATWTTVFADKFVEDPEGTSCSFFQYLGATPIVNPSNGTLYVVSEKFTVDDPNCDDTGTLTSSEVLFTSHDGGQTFGNGVTIADVTPSFPSGALQLGPGQFVRNLELPAIALFGNKIYVAWNDGASGNSHIMLARSSNGTTWNVRAITSGSGDEMQPALSADASGVHVLYYHRNPDNTLDAVVANSNPVGNNFTPRLVTTQPFPGVFTLPQFDPIIAFEYMGDYIANVSDGTHQYFAWGDNRDVVTNSLWPAGRNDPDVFFAKQ